MYFSISLKRFPQCMVRLNLSVSNVTYEVIGKKAAEYCKILNDTIIIIAKLISNFRRSWKIYVYA